jgi:hypothetical protein
MPQSLYLCGKGSWYPLDRNLGGGPHTQSGNSGEEKKVHHSPYQELNPLSSPLPSLYTDYANITKLTLLIVI